MNKHFLTRLLITDAVLLALLMVLQLTKFIPSFMPFSWFCLAFFNVVSIIIFSVSAPGAVHSSAHRFVNTITISFGLKFFLCIAGIISYILIVKPKGLVVIIPFFFFYVIFTALELSELLFLLKGLKNRQGNEH